MTKKNKNLPLILLTVSSSLLDNLIQCYLSKNFKILVISQDTLKSIANDEKCFNDLKSKLSKKIIYGIIHLAFHRPDKYSSKKKVKSDLYFLNVEITRVIAKLGISLKVQKFIFLSTTEIYGKGHLNPNKLFDTFSPTIPDNLFAASKLSAEYALQSIFSNNPKRLVILRVADFLSKDSIFCFRLLGFLNKNKIPIPVLFINNYPIPSRAFCIPDYACEFIISVLKNKIPSGSIYNVFSKNFSLIDLLNFYYNETSNNYFKIKLNFFIVNFLLKIPLIRKYISPYLLSQKIIS